MAGIADEGKARVKKVRIQGYALNDRVKRINSERKSLDKVTQAAEKNNSSKKEGA
jgi:hypothetical protein